MRLVSYGPAGQERLGALVDDGRYILDLNRADGRIPPTLLDFLRGDFWVRTRERLVDTQKTAPSALVERAGVRLGAPVPRPGLIVCVGLNYKDHADEQGDPYPPAPLLFGKAPGAACGPEDDIVYPDGVTRLDYEVELAVIVGRTAKKVPAAKAAEAIAGYCVLNDVSARCAQFGDKQWFRGKSFDTFCPLGPWIETDLNPDNCRIRAILNGRTMQDSSTSDMIFDCRQLVSYLSHCMTLYPGTAIMTGTPSGVGFTRKPPVFLRPGDVVEVVIDGIGTLRNTVLAEAPPGN